MRNNKISKLVNSLRKLIEKSCGEPENETIMIEIYVYHFQKIEHYYILIKHNTI